MVLSAKIILIVIAGCFLAAFMDSMAGGGGIISIPAYLLAGLPVHLALGTNKLSAGTGSLFCSFIYAKKGFADLKLAVPGMACAMCGAVIGTYLQLLVAEKYLEYMLLAALPIVAVVVLRKKTLPEVTEPMQTGKRLAVICIASFVIGIYNGFYGMGTGTFLLLIFCSLAKMDVRRANGNVKLINLTADFSSMLTALISGKVWVTLGLIAAVASIGGNLFGAKLAIKNGSKIVRPTVVVVLVLLAVKILWDFLSAA